MNIIVCLKQVPATTKVQIDAKTSTLVRQGVKGIINPFDTYALEEGVRLREKLGGKVTVISMGPPQADESLREALSVGADEAILLSDRAFAGADTLATSLTISAAIRKTGAYDLIICGRQTIDGDTGQVAPEIAALLDLPCAAYVSRIEDANEKCLRVRRMVEGGYEVAEVQLPAVRSVTKERNTPRLPSLRGQIRAKSAKIPVWTAAELSLDSKTTGLEGSPTRVVKIFYPQRERKGEILEGDAARKVETLIARLKDARVI